LLTIKQLFFATAQHFSNFWMELKNIMTRLPICRTAIAAFAGIALLNPLAAVAQTDWVAQVRQYLIDRAEIDLPDYVLSGRIITGSLNQANSQSRIMRLYAGVDYAFMASCDSDCQDVDLYLYDRRGNLLDSDIEDNDYPIVFITPSITANYRIEASMYSCSAEPCYYAIGRFEASE
jgi:hypothetical protein